MRGYSVVQVRPMCRSSRCGQCRWLQSSLRVSPAGAGAAWGGSASERGGQAGSIKGAPAPPGEGGGADTGGGLAPGRWPGRAVHAARAGGLVTGGPAGDLGRQRICPSRRP